MGTLSGAAFSVASEADCIEPLQPERPASQSVQSQPHREGAKRGPRAGPLAVNADVESSCARALAEELRAAARRPRPAWVMAAQPYADDPLADADIPPAQRRALVDLDGKTCRWPVGDPSSPHFFFCGAVPLAGKPYCDRHAARAYRAAADGVSALASAEETDDAGHNGDRYCATVRAGEGR